MVCFFLVVIECIFVYEYILKYKLISLYASPMCVVWGPFGIDNQLVCTFLEENCFSHSHQSKLPVVLCVRLRPNGLSPIHFGMSVSVVLV